MRQQCQEATEQEHEGCRLSWSFKARRSTGPQHSERTHLRGKPAAMKLSSPSRAARPRPQQTSLAAPSGPARLLASFGCAVSVESLASEGAGVRSRRILADGFAVAKPGPSNPRSVEYPSPSDFHRRTSCGSRYERRSIFPRRKTVGSRAERGEGGRDGRGHGIADRGLLKLERTRDDSFDTTCGLLRYSYCDGKSEYSNKVL